jgi:hypothetical protein
MKIETFLIILAAIGFAAFVSLPISAHYFSNKHLERAMKHDEAMIESRMQKYCEKMKEIEESK